MKKKSENLPIPDFGGEEKKTPRSLKLLSVTICEPVKEKLLEWHLKKIIYLLFICIRSKKIINLLFIKKKRFFSSLMCFKKSSSENEVIRHNSLQNQKLTSQEIRCEERFSMLDSV